MKAHECLLGANDLLVNLRKLRSDDLTISGCGRLRDNDDECSFVELGSVWQAPLFEISLYVNQDNRPTTQGTCYSFHDCFCRHNARKLL